MRVFFTVIFLIPILISYFHINQDNFSFRREVQAQLVQHPERLPKAEYSELMFPGFSNITANVYWLQAIQYVWRNAVSSEYKMYFFEMMNLITELNPYFESPYVLGQLLLPSWSKSNPNEDFSEIEIGNHNTNARSLWQKWIENFCDIDTLEKIFKQEDLSKINTDDRYKNPCRSYLIPYHLAFIYFYYLKDYTQAANYYKVVTAQDDSPSWARTLAWIMQWRSWDRAVAIFMFLSLAQSASDNDEICSLLSSELETVYTYLRYEDISLTWEFIEEMEILRDELFPIDEESIEREFSNLECGNFLGRAIREFSLLYLEQADQLYREENLWVHSAGTPERLYESGFITFIPSDFQQWSDYKIIYRYDEDSERWDYKMWF